MPPSQRATLAQIGPVQSMTNLPRRDFVMFCHLVAAFCFRNLSFLRKNTDPVYWYRLINILPPCTFRPQLIFLVIEAEAEGLSAAPRLDSYQVSGSVVCRVVMPYWGVASLSAGLQAGADCLHHKKKHRQRAHERVAFLNAYSIDRPTGRTRSWRIRKKIAKKTKKCMRDRDYRRKLASFFSKPI